MIDTSRFTEGSNYTWSGGATCMAMLILRFETGIEWDTMSHIILDFLFECLGGHSVLWNTGGKIYPFKRQHDGL